jgi:hypothetical protein
MKGGRKAALFVCGRRINIISVIIRHRVGAKRRPMAGMTTVGEVDALRT